MSIPREKSTEVKIGLFTVFGALLLVLIVVILGKERKLFEESYFLYAEFPDVAGLEIGGDVMLSGVHVGQVTSIAFPELKATDPAQKKEAENRHNITVELRVAASSMPHIRQDSVSRIDSMGLLGDKIINITLGTMAAQQHENGDTLQSTAPIDMNKAVLKGQQVLDNLVASSDELKGALTDFTAKGGDAAMAEAMKSLRNIMQEVEQGDGVVHQLIYDGESGGNLKVTMQEMETALTAFASNLEKLDRVMGEVESGRGLVHELVYGQDGPKTLAKAKGVLSEMETVVSDIRKGPGLLHNVIYRDDNGEFISNLNQATHEIQVLTAEIKEGRGTLGALIKDPSIYEDLKLLLGNVQRNATVKALMRYAIEERERQVLQEAKKAKARHQDDD